MSEASTTPGQAVSHGRIVEYTFSAGDAPPGAAEGDRRAAVIVRVWSPEAAGNGCANLLVFLDGENDVPVPPGAPSQDAAGQIAAAMAWMTSRTFDPDGAPGTWRWPTRV